MITGRKMWTSGAKSANMTFALCRTDPDAPKHRGISYVLVPFSADNHVTIRRVRQMTGAAEFCEDFLDGARAPRFNVIGGLNNGWAPAMTTLGYERGGNATTAYLGYEQEVCELVSLARRAAGTGSPRSPAPRVVPHPGSVDAVRRAAAPVVARRRPRTRPRGVDRQARVERISQDIRGGRARRRRDRRHGPPRRQRVRHQRGRTSSSRASRGRSTPARARSRENHRERALGLPKEPPALRAVDDAAERNRSRS